MRLSLRTTSNVSQRPQDDFWFLLQFDLSTATIALTLSGFCLLSTSRIMPSTQWYFWLIGTMLRLRFRHRLQILTYLLT